MIQSQKHCGKEKLLVLVLIDIYWYELFHEKTNIIDSA